MLVLVGNCWDLIRISVRPTITLEVILTFDLRYISVFFNFEVYVLTALRQEQFSV